MGKINTRRRQSKLAIRRRQKHKIARLRQIYVLAKSESERQKIILHAMTINRHLTTETFINAVKKTEPSSPIAKKHTAKKP